ncbi:hypothetical protein Tco_1533065, partial [Tanacetum coccineum]
FFYHNYLHLLTMKKLDMYRSMQIPLKDFKEAARKEFLLMPCAEIDDLDNAHLLAEGIIDKA